MGAGQSSNAHAPAAGETKTSYYELLGIERTATEEEVKKAYRRKALELHPDRNYGDVERTTALFAEIQSAYQVLSDSQERAWYDAHEGEILRGGEGGGGEAHYEHDMRVTTTDDIARIIAKFGSKVEFTDSPTGFYGFLRETFDQLAKEEEYAADWDGLDVPQYPSFGSKDDTYEGGVVRDFYAGWNGFATKKSFAWMDLYRTSDAPDRQYRRAMDKENKKLREDGKREFNEAVRALVQFVRKRDPRYTPLRESDEDRAKKQRAARQAQAAKAKAAQASIVQDAVPAWASARDPEELEQEEEEDVEEEHYECVACHKTFKSEQQYDAHEKSKKHQKAVQALRRKMQKENAYLNLDDDTPTSGIITPMSGGDDEVPSGDVASEDASDQSELDASIGDLREDLQDLQVDPGSASISDEEQDPDASSAPHKAASTPDTASTSGDDEYGSRSDIEARLAGFRKDATVHLNDSDEESAAAPVAPKLGKAKQKKAKKAAKQAELDEEELKFKCATCNGAFPSKTQLFQHIKDLDHAAPVTVTKAGKGGGGGGGGKKAGKKKR